MIRGDMSEGARASTMAGADKSAERAHDACQPYDDDDDESSDEASGQSIGQLVLSVDFAPPAELRWPALERPSAAARADHVVEVSLCSKQRRIRASELPAPPPAPPAPSERQPGERRKRRLIYERIDKFPVKLSRPLGERERRDARASRRQDNRQDLRPLVLPFANSTFDACFCFNLLNLRVASGRLLSLERLTRSCEAQPRARLQEAERSWRRMAQLTSELRLAVLAELSRVVKPRGKIMITVFAYECWRRASDQPQQQQPARDAPRRKRQDPEPGECRAQPDADGCRYADLDSCCLQCRLELAARRGKQESRHRRRTDGRTESLCDTGSRAGDEARRQSAGAAVLLESTRRYSAALLRAVSAAASSGSQDRSLPLNAEALGETARRLGRRLSSGGSSLLGRLFAPATTCDPAEPSDTEQPQLHPSDYASRHRQSIAVQTFFTKSIADDEDEPLARLGVACREGGAPGECSDEEPTTNESTTSGWTAPSQSLASRGPVSSLSNGQVSRPPSDCSGRRADRVAANRSSPIIRDHLMIDGADSNPNVIGSSAAANDLNRDQHPCQLPAAAADRYSFPPAPEDDTLGGVSSAGNNTHTTSGSGHDFSAFTLATSASTNPSLSCPTSASNSNSGERDHQRHRRRVVAPDERPRRRQLHARSAADERELLAAGRGLGHRYNEPQFGSLPLAAGEGGGGGGGVISLAVSSAGANKGEAPQRRALSETEANYHALDAPSSASNGQPQGASARDPNRLGQRWSAGGRDDNLITRPKRLVDGDDSSGNNNNGPRADAAPTGECASAAPSGDPIARDPRREAPLNANGRRAPGQDNNGLGAASGEPRSSDSLTSTGGSGAGNAHQSRHHYEASAAPPLRVHCSGSTTLATRTTISTSSSSGASANALDHDNNLLPHLGRPGAGQQVSRASSSGGYHAPANTPSSGAAALPADPTRRASVQLHNLDEQQFVGQQHADSAAARQQVAAARHQQHQWRQSNTFSSSLNSDISTSGPKDTTEKDSSRRTSTLSGISSIYQQETSIGQASASYSATPATSSQAAPSNMGSIPELATGSSGRPDERESGRSMSLQSQQAARAPEQRPLLVGEDAHQNGDGINLQRVAQSFKIQLREKLNTTMRPINALMGIGSNQDLNQEAAGPSTVLGGVDPETSTCARPDVPHSPSCSTAQLRSAPHRPPSPEQANSGAQQPTSLPAAATSALRHSSSKTESPTPATLKSFFRSTSSAAFNAFASSFHQSSSSTPTATTVYQQHVFGQQPTNGSISSDVFDTTTLAATSGGSALASTSAATPSDGQVAAEEPSASGQQQAPRSPLSPIPISSARFFARIRDKFSLSSSPTGQQQQLTSPLTRPSSAISNTNSAATTIVAAQSQPKPEERGQRQPAPPELADNSSLSDTLNSGLTSTTSTSNRKSSVNSTSANEAANEDTSTTSSSRKNQQPAARPASGQNLAPRNRSSPDAKRGDTFDSEYEQVISLRRPSFQRQLDEQVNQIYRLAVERKLQATDGSQIFEATECTSSDTHAPQLRAGAGPYREYHSDLSSIIVPVGGKLGGAQAGGSSFGSIYSPVDAHYATAAVESGYGTRAAPNQPRKAAHAGNPMRWNECSQQSIESSSSIRSLRSCWFSMPELYAMNGSGNASDSTSSQSPSEQNYFAGQIIGANGDIIIPLPQQAPVDDLLEVLSDKSLQPERKNDQQPPAECWPSSELCRQVTSDCGQNWTLSDLQLTSDDIAVAPRPNPTSCERQQRAALQPQPQLVELVKCSTLDDSICASIKSASSARDLAGGGNLSDNSSRRGSEANRPLLGDAATGSSRPTSQNSTISSTSCALSDLGSNTDNNRLAPATSPTSSPLSPDIRVEGASSGGGGPESSGCEEGVPGAGLSPAPKQQRAMSLVITPDQRAAGRPASPNSLLVGAPRVRRRSAMGNLGDANLAPAAATLDLRLANRNKNRIKLSDLHPITFMNDRKFLNSMSSLKNASDNKLDAIFNSPVGRRLSVNAELAQQSPFNQAKSGIKIGLTGYVYLEPKGNNGADNNRLARSFRRPSLAPNFWRQQQHPGSNRDDNPNGAASNHLSVGQGSGLAAGSLRPDSLEVRPRARSASCTPLVATDKIPPPPSASPERDQHQTRTRPKSPAQFDPERRRSTLSLLERLSESSVELENYAGATQNDNEPVGVYSRRCQSSGESPIASSSSQLGRRNQGERRGSSLLKIDEHSGLGEPNDDNNIGGSISSVTAKLVGPKKGNRPSDCSSDSDDNEREQNKSARAAKSAVNANDSSSSDDGDIEKLVSQYEVIGDHQQHLADSFLLESFVGGRRGHGRHHALPGSMRAALARADRHSIVNNDKILRQILLASNAASLVAAKPGDSPEGATNRTGGCAGVGADYRRFSAINLYQRDEDVFVANSMKRPPTSQIQVLQALPLLAGTLPVIPSAPEPREAVAQPKQTQLPVLRASRTGAKSIITGNSGLNSSPMGSTLTQPIGGDRTDFMRATSVSSVLVAEVDVEEQLNRLRKQEKRSLAFGSGGSSSRPKSTNDRANLSTDSESESTTLRDQRDTPESLDSLDAKLDVSVPDEPPIIPEILRPPEGDTKTSESLESTAQAATASTTTTSTCANTMSPSAPMSPPHSPIPRVSPTGSPSAILLPSVAPPPSQSTFKQLDTIIEGRGLLLGAEQQADPTYANRLRRLSGNHPRRSSLGQSQVISEADQTNAPSTSAAQDSGIASCSYDEWCQCDLIAPVSRKSALAAAGARSQPTATSTSSARDGERSRQHAQEAAEQPSELRSGEDVAAAPGGRDQSSQASMLDQMKSLARRTLTNLGASIGSPRLAPVTPTALGSRQQRSSSMVVGSSRLFEAPDRQLQDSRPTLPSRMLNERLKASRLRQRESDSESSDSNSEHGDTSAASHTHSLTASPDDSSLISLDDAENYRAKNKENKMKHGRSLESSSSISSSSSSSSASTISATGAKDEPANDEVEDEEEQIYDDEDDEETYSDDDDDDMKPKICYKCNKKILMDPINSSAYAGEPFNQSLELSDLDTSRLQHQSSGQVERQGDPSAPRASADPNASGVPTSDAATSAAESSSRAHRRRGAATRRSASMNAADHEPVAGMTSGTGTGSGGHINRRKNKWHIQRNLAPKLKRQRSFSANYAPEIPNPMMPPPRRFSAAPTLTCPHKNKSSSHSGSSLHHTCSIDSSESMITVIPADRGLASDFAKRSPGGSLYTTGQSGSGIPQRSPLSPRSPRSPSLLTPNTSCEPLAGILEAQPQGQPPFSPTTTTNTSTTCSGRVTVIQQLPQQQQGSSSKLVPVIPSIMNQYSSLESDQKSSCNNISTLPDTDTLQGTPTSASMSGIKQQFDYLDCDSDLAVEKGTSLGSSHNDLNEFFPENGTITNLEEQRQLKSQRIHDFFSSNYNDQNHEDEQLEADERSESCDSNYDLRNVDPDSNSPMICETINDYCADHSREELEFLVKKVGSKFRINDCYYSEVSSTVCMIVEVVKPQ